MQLNLKLTQKIKLAFFITLTCEIVFVGYLWFMLQGAQQEINEANRVRMMISSLTELSNDIQETSMNAMMRLIAPTTKGERYETALNRVSDKIDRLRDLSDGRPSETQAINELRSTISVAPELLMTAMNNFEVDNQKHYAALTQLAQASHTAVQQVNHMLVGYQQIQDAERESQFKSREHIKDLLLLGLVLNVCGGFFIVIWITKPLTHRLEVLTENALRFAAGQKLNPPLAGDDEITTVDRAFHVMAENVEESKRKETAVIENALDVICSIDADGRFVEVNPACISVWGYSPDDLIGKRYAEIVDRSQSKTNAPQIPAMTKEKSQSAYENRIVRKDGAVVDMLWSARWSDREQSWFCVAHDITDRKKSEQLRRDFVAMISHDLRTPLTAVDLSLQILSCGACGELGEKAVSNVTNAERNLSFVMHLINSLLDVERMNAGKLEMRLSPMSIGDVISRSVEAVKPLCERDGVRLVVESIDTDIVGDEDRMVQVLVNLLSNALKFSGKGSEIVLNAHEDAGFVEISVTDNGPGIPADQQNKIFERFERGAQTRKQIEGTGLGLAICKAIIEQHNGTISVSSREGKGSKFFFRIAKLSTASTKVSTRKPGLRS